MKSLRNILLVFLVPLVISGCATMKGKIGSCEIIGGVAGGTTGAIVAEKAIWGIPAIAVGAVLGHMVCPDGDGDADGDKVSDSQDACPNTPAGVVVYDDNGCPMDSDKDGVPNYLDKCLETLPGIKVNNEGCVACGETLANLQNKVYFNFAECNLKSNAKQAMESVVKALKDTNTQILIEGHTDNIGSYESNRVLSECRANAVKDYLISRGIVGSNITTEGKGQNFPIASNETERGRAKNRRVKIVSICK
uniref:OmpA-OmpF porin, OOP family n=1 Tax=Candidatus Kentrum sp. FW TaxID=2126338 RepID=A0A450S9U7_9GAMM|nr:MAG: OmpA-OmpF porin, OOP family [Candidatus Kentron sp. FW]